MQTSTLRNMYNSLTPSPKNSAETPIYPSRHFLPPPPPRIPPPPPPPLPPSFIPPPVPEPLPPVFGPESYKREWNSLKKEIFSHQQQIKELETKLNLWQNTNRPKRAYTEGSIPSSERDVSLLCATLARFQTQKRHLVQSIAHLEEYSSPQPPYYERGIDFFRDKCVDNASRKLEKNKSLLKKTETQISILEGQIPPALLVSHPLSPKRATKKGFSKKKPKFFTLKKRAKTWPFA